MGLFSEGGAQILLLWLASAAIFGAVVYVIQRRAPVRIRMEPLFAERELEFNRKSLETSIVRHGEQLYDYRNDESHRVFADYLRSYLNLEMLKLADGKAADMNLQDYAYLRGRVDGLRAVLNTREVAIQNKELLRKAGAKDPEAQEAKRSYVRAPATHAGLSI